MIVGFGTNETIAKYLTYATVIIIILGISAIAKIITDKIILKIIRKQIKGNKHQWDDFLIQRNVFKRLSHIIPAIIFYFFASVFPSYEEIIRSVLSIYFLFIILLTVDAFLSALNDIYATLPNSKNKPIKGFIQVIKIIVYTVGIIILIANLLGESPTVILGGISAFTAVLVLVFKDAILGFVAGVQITSNDMVRLGDWIEIDKYNANGEVIDISLNTIKIRNFDNTIISLPAYALISDSFKNWRGMQETGARRIKRSIQIDVNSIKHLNEEMINKLKKITFITEYIEDKQKEINVYNKENKVDASNLVNGRHQTNIGVFRAYIENYLKNNPNISQDKIIMVRQISTTGEGLTLEIYAFTNTIDWKEYEKIQADIFDHVVSIVPEFGLHLFQTPSGNDIKKIITK